MPAGQLLLTRRSKTRMYTVGIVFEFYTVPLKGAQYRVWCGVNRLGDSGVKVVLIDSAVLLLLLSRGQLLLTRRGKTRMYTVGIVFEFYTVPL